MILKVKAYRAWYWASMLSLLGIPERYRETVPIPVHRRLCKLWPEPKRAGLLLATSQIRGEKGMLITCPQTRCELIFETPPCTYFPSRPFSVGLTTSDRVQ